MSKTLLYVLILVLAGVSGAMLVQTQAAANGGSDDSRQTEIVASVTEYQWWLARWETNDIVCVVGVETEGQPGAQDVLADCGEVLYKEWVATHPCEAAQTGGNTAACPGLYMFFVGQETVEKTVIVDLPVPTIWIELTGCTPQPPLNRCDRLPTLVFTAEEPLPNESILAIHVLTEDGIVDCSGNRCEFPLKPTFVEGQEIEFWADSTYGDESEHFIARARVIDTGISSEDTGGNWFVDIISSQWRGKSFSSCAAMWEAFPTIGGGPEWLNTPPDHTMLASNTPYVYLAGELIRYGQVDASRCVDQGLLANGAASQCGLETARSAVNDWQDQFDEEIYNIAQDHNIPAQLLKNLFAQESQFWPGETADHEYGLGQLTEQGADTTLLWNTEFYSQFCPLVLHEETCAKGYAFLGDENQALLRGALASQSGALCPTCPLGVDLAHASTTINLFAETLVANCSQVAFITSDITGLMPGITTSYEDLWRFTLASYNAGPYCLAKAVNSAWRQQRKLDWPTVSARLSSGCSGAILYVDRITRDRLPSDADFLYTPTPTITPIRPTPTPTRTLAPTGTPITLTPTPITPTPTLENYPPPTTPTSFPPTETPFGYP